MQTIGTDTRTTLIENASSGRYLQSGQLVYGQGGTLFAVAIDIPHRKIVGASTPVVEGVLRSLISGFRDFPFCGLGHRLTRLRSRINSQSDGTRAGRHRSGRIEHRAPSSLQGLTCGRGRRTTGNRSRSKSTTVRTPTSQSSLSPRRILLVVSPLTDTIACRSGPPMTRMSHFSRIGTETPGSICSELMVAAAGASLPLTKAQPDEVHIPESWSPDGHTLLYTVRKKGSYVTVDVVARRQDVARVRRRSFGRANRSDIFP